MAARIGEICVTLLLVVLPWHEFIVMAAPSLAAWKEVTLAVAVGTLGVAGARRLKGSPVFWALLAVGGATMASAVAAHDSWLLLRPLLAPMAAGVAASILPQDAVPRVVRRFLAGSLPVTAYGILSYAAFRAIGGRHDFRVPVPQSGFLWLLVRPYYTLAYYIGERLVGSFLNDNYFGIWAVAVVSLACVLVLSGAGARRLGLLAAALALPALAWTSSRSAAFSLVAAVSVLAWKVSRRLIVLLGIVVLAATVYLTPRLIDRFVHPMANAGERMASVRNGLRTLEEGSLLGHGPGSQDVQDQQAARLAWQFGWVGILAFAGAAGAVLRPGLLPPASQVDPRLHAGLAAAVLGMFVGGVGTSVLEVPQTSYTLWIMAGLLAVSASPATASDSQESESETAKLTILPQRRH